jgi:hypothetical protein
MNSSEKIIWSDERQKWLCYDDKLIDAIINSNLFIVPSYDYSDLEKKFSKNFEFTKQVIKHFPLANEGDSHLEMRRRMSSDINLNLKKAIKVFGDSFERKILSIDKSAGITNIAKPLIESILESNLVFADIKFEDDFDYSDLTRMLDDSQSIKIRVAREEFIKLISSKINYENRFYKLALISVGVNALISSTLHSLIKILTNYDFNTLISRKYFASNGIKHLERVCIQKTIVGGKEISPSDKLRLYVEGYEHANLTEPQMNKKFFATESHHSCIGMNYSLSIWKEVVQVISSHFSDMHVINFDYRSNDGIFHFPSNINVKYSK